MRKLLTACAVLVLVGAVGATTAPCWDKTDQLIVKLKKLDLTTEQLEDIFGYQEEHRDLIASCHRDGRGCSVHERREVEFEKASIGVLTDAQFERLTGRERNETETLRYQNHLLRKEIARLRAQLEALEAQAK